ncbi:MAG: ABC transporter permease [Verrucomicrobiales bacterium]|nr:ABC transporter permease [Verrucomicrobiales bacterium]
MFADLRLAVRQLRRDPAFTIIATLTLALGIGANTAIFSVLDQLLVRPLPVHQPHQLALLKQARANSDGDFEFNFPLFRDYQRLNTVFSDLCATADQSVGLGAAGSTERHQALFVSGNYFALLGVPAALGRVFAADEGVDIDDANVVVLGHGLWLRRFGADPQVLGRSVTVNGKPFQVIGVAPKDFQGTTRGFTPELYLPITTYGQLTASLRDGEHPLRTRFFVWHQILGRLRNGIRHAEAEAAMNLLARQVYQETPANTSTNLLVVSGHQGFTSQLQDARLPLYLLFATAGVVLLIACANLGNLQLARAAARSRDFAIRLAMGANRRRILRQLLTESLLLSTIGGLLGILVARSVASALQIFRPSEANVDFSADLDPRMLVFTLATSMLSGVLFGLAPAWRASRPQVIPELKGTRGTNDTGIGRTRLRHALVVFQVALSLVVLVGAGLCLRSLSKLHRLDPGLEPSKVVLLSFDLELNNYSDARTQVFQRQLLDRVRLLPGVEAASLAANTPLDGRNWGMSVERVEGYTPSNPRERPVGHVNTVGTDYFRTVGLQLLQGRTFQDTDHANGPKVVIINEAFAQRFFKASNPIGKLIYQHGPDGGVPTEVVGVVESSRLRKLNESPRPAFYFPLAQERQPNKALTLAVRTGIDPKLTLSQLISVVRAIDADLPIFDQRTLAEQKSGSLALERMAALLLAAFGLLALALSALGIYGVLAYSVSRRTAEIGVRMALGARIHDVLAMVLRQGMGMTAIGIALGLALAIGTTRVLKNFLFQIEPLDPGTFGGVLIILTAAAGLACWLPARRAAAVDPMVALRNNG